MGERVGGRKNFRYLPPRQRAVASARQRFFSTRLGLRTVEVIRPLIGRSGPKAG
jgi:hypothetical protein